jgi:hypothetical protein
MEPTHAILTSSAVYLIIVIFIKARSCSTGGERTWGGSLWKQKGEASAGETTTHHLYHFLAAHVHGCTTERDAVMYTFLTFQSLKRHSPSKKKKFP